MIFKDWKNSYLLSKALRTHFFGIIIDITVVMRKVTGGMNK